MSSGFSSLPAVDYADVRSELRTGDLLLCAGSGWFSKMIQAATDSSWSHVALIFRLESLDRVMVLESLEPVGVRAVPLSKYLRDYDSRGNPYPGKVCLARHTEFETHASPADLARLGHFAVDQFGYPYDNQMVAKIAARIMLSKWLQVSAPALSPAMLPPLPLERNREYICSEYVWECYQTLGIEVPHDPRGFVAPKDFAEASAVEALAVLRLDAR